MSKFLKLLFLFLTPFILLIFNYMLFFKKSEGDLNRLGKVVFDPDYRTQFQHQFNKPKLYFELSPQVLKTSDSVGILTLGDSFSDQNNYGYQNYLSSFQHLKVYNLDKKFIPKNNQIEFAFALKNENILYSMNVKYLILQVVEREFVRRGTEINMNQIIPLHYFDLDRTISEVPKNSDLNIIKDIFRFPLYNSFYNFHNKGLISPVYKMKLKSKLFTTRDQELFFFEGDIDNLIFNDFNNIQKLNDNLNFLSDELNKNNIKLIVLPAPDKYDLYQDFIADNPLPDNNFFDMFNELKKNYIYINSKKLLKNYLNNGKKDVYFADDTHWSPIASKIIAKEISELIKLDSNH